MASGEARLAVWVGPEEKLVSGLSRRTTCAEVVRALLEESRGRPLGAGPPRGSLPEEEEEEEEEAEGAFCLVERWRGLERALPAQTRLLRLWGAWGAEREHLRFLLRRRPSGPQASCPPALPGPRSAEARVVPSRQRGPPQESAASPGAPLLLRPEQQERQRRVVRKAFRKLAKLKRRKGGGGGSPLQERRRKKEQPQQQQQEAEAEAEAEEGAGQGCRRRASRMAALVQLVLAQDQTLREQSKRLRELDGQIERYEARLHLERMRRHGVNYVQETYLESGAPEEEEQQGREREREREREEGGQGERGAGQQPGEGGCSSRGPGPVGWAALAALAEERARQEALGESLAAQIQEELNRRWMRRRRQELALAAASRSASSSPSETDCETTELLGREPLPAEEERLRTQLSTSLYIGLRLSTDLHAAREALEDSQRAWREKERQLRRLLQEEEQQQQEEEEEEEEEEGCPPEPSGKAGRQEEEEGDGEDSDTGLSSMHSQDSDSGPGGGGGGGGGGGSESLV